MESLLPGSSLGRYQLVEWIGRGGMASVFRALDPQLKRHVAIKVLPSYQAADPTFVERFKREAQAVARLNHPNIVRIHDFGDDKGFTYIVMELVTGGSLQERMDRRFSLTEVLHLVTPLAQALESAHGEGIVHRDIKPSNVLLDAEGNPILSDFGLARMLEGSAGLTRPDSVLGTPAYMSPEQALGRPADQRSDIYSLAVMVFEMLMGRPPFQAETPSAVLMAHIHQQVPLPSTIDPEIDPGLEALLLKALSKSPDDRYQSAPELVRSLASIAGGTQQAPTVEGPATIEASAAPQAESRQQIDEVVVQAVSLDEARGIALRHARDNTDLYGPRFSTRQLVWQVVGVEESGDAYKISLSYAPTGRFRGTPGIEIMTVTKAGAVEDREVLKEPVEKRRIPAFMPVAVGVALVAGAGAAWLAISTLAGNGDGASTERTVPAATVASPDQPAAQSPTAVSVAIAPTEPETLVPRAAEAPTPVGTAILGAGVTPASEMARTPVPTAAPAARDSPPATIQRAPATQTGLATLDPALKTIFQRVSALRELEPLEELVPQFVTGPEIRRLILDQELNSKRSEIEREQALLSLLGLIPADLDLYQLRGDIESEGLDAQGSPPAFYDRETRRLYVNQDVAEFTPLDEFAVAYAYARAMLQQHFDVYALARRAEEDPEASAALDALVSGDAVTAAQEYMSAHIAPEQFAALPPPKRTPIFDSAPNAVKQKGAFHQAGVSFLRAISQSGRWSAVRLVYNNPPISTEQIYHPAKYLAGERPVEIKLPDLVSPLGPGWTELQTSVMGERGLRLYLTGLSQVGSREAAAGWGGDKYKLLEGPDGDRLFATLSIWDTPEDAREFFEFVVSNTADSDKLYVGIQQDRVLLIIGPDGSTVTTVRDQFLGF